MLDHIVDGGAGRRTGQGIASERSAVNANSGRHAISAKNRSHRHTTRNAFSKTHHVRCEIKVLTGKEPAGAAETCLHLINDQQRAPFGTKASRRVEILCLRWTDTSFPLNDFEEDSAGVVINGCVQFLNIV